MLNQQSNKWFECLKVFSDLSGRKKQCLAVGDSAAARTGRFLFLDRVEHYWPSQWHTRYKRGFMEFFENHTKFDLQNETIDGKRVFLFNVTPEIYNIWCRQTIEERIIRKMDEMPPHARLAAERLIYELADPKGCNQLFRWSDARTLLPALSLSQLSDLAELFDMANDGGETTLQAAAQSVHDTPLDSPTDAPRVKSPASHTGLPATNVSEWDDFEELFGMSAHTTPSVPPAAAQRVEVAPVSL